MTIRMEPRKLPIVLHIDTNLINASQKLASVKSRKRGLCKFILIKVILQGAYLYGANLKKANLRRAYLDNANLQEANLKKAKFCFAILNHARLSEAKLQKATFREAELLHAILYRAKLQKADFLFAKLQHANLLCANLKGTSLKNAFLNEVVLNHTVKWDYKTSFLNSNGVDVSRNPLLRRHIEDEQYLDAYKDRAKGSFFGRLLAILWRFTCDYGRSLSRWALLTILFIVIFGILYSMDGLIDKIPSNPFYYSVVSLFGFIDINQNYWGIQVLTGVEMVLGYLMLGGLISIFATKLARRS